MTRRISQPTTPWTVTAATVTGSSHNKSGLPCQDDGRWEVLQSAGTLVLVVSDGAGSGKLTQFASATAVRSCCYALRQHAARDGVITCESVRAAASHAAQDVLKLYQIFERRPGGALRIGDFACTLVVAAVNARKLVMLQIGDGAVVTDSPEGLRCLSPVLHREYANEAEFLVTPNALAKAFTYEEDDSIIRGIAVMSDGVQSLGVEYPSNRPFARLFRPLFDHAVTHRAVPQTSRDESLERFLKTDAVNESTDDDRTLIMAVREVACLD